ncbi:MAG: carboxypeptidase regulatory-like domain-containing protein [Deltaproteobacteria bacterium]|nr:carboxypeptidase regulatory-like domain-containing protein [Deltaproteobacteria bacterium]
MVCHSVTACQAPFAEMDWISPAAVASSPAPASKSISGTVLDAAGGPLVAEVSLESIPWEESWSRPSWSDMSGQRRQITGKACRYRQWSSATTPEPETQIERTTASDQDGAFAFAGLPAGTYHLVARAPGLLPVGRPLTLRQKTALGEIVLIAVPGKVFCGRVVDLGGRPLAGAEVEGRSVQGGFASGRTDRRGHFCLELGAAHPVRAVLSARAEGYLPEHVPAQPGSPARLVLKRPVRLAGLVSLDGQPVASAEVFACTDRVRTATDSSGRFAIDGLPPDTVRIRARLGANRSSEVIVDLSSGPVEDAQIPLQGTGAIEMRIIDSTGRALTGIPVRVEFLDDIEPRTLTTDGDGVARFAAVPAGLRHACIRLPGSASTDLYIRVAPGTTHGRTLVMRPGHLVRVRVRLQGGGELRDPDIAVRLDPEEPLMSLGDRYSLESDPAQIPIAYSSMVEDGVAGFEGVPPGRYAARLVRSDLVAAPVPVCVPGPEVTLVAREGAIQGLVVDRGGQRLAGLLVLSSAAGRSLDRCGTGAWTDALGRFRIEPGEDIPYWLEVDDQDYVSAGRIRASAGERGLVLEADPALVIEGVVLDDAGRPVEAGVQSRAARSSVRTDAEGRFRLGGLRPGSYDLLARSGGLRSEAVQVQAGERSVRLALPGRLGSDFTARGRFLDDSLAYSNLGAVQLRPVCAVLGEVVSPAGAPVPGATIRGWTRSNFRLIFNDRDQSFHDFEVKTDSHGRFTLTESLWGEVALQAEMPGYGPSMSQDFSAPGPGEQKRVRLELTARPKHGSLRGRITAYRTPVPGVQVTVAGGAFLESVLTGPDGRFHFARVPPGRLSMTAFDCRGRRATARVLLDPGDDLELDLSLEHLRNAIPVQRDWCQPQKVR